MLRKVSTYSERTPHRPVCVDIETAPDGSVIDIAIAAQWPIDGERIVTVHPSWDSALDEIQSHLYSDDKYEREYYSRLYAHNGGRFDWLSLYAHMRETCPDRLGEMALSGSNPISIKVRLPGANGLRVVELRDSARLMPAPLADLAKDFNVGFKRSDVDYSDMRAWKAAHTDEYYEYLRQDVLMLQDVILSFWQELYAVEGSIGRLPCTIASLALRIFSKYLPKNLLVPRQKDLLKLSEDAYSGGRTECYRRGEFENAVASDINSMYPSVMRSEVYPLSYKGYWTWEYKADKLGLWRVNYVQADISRPAILRPCRTSNFAHAGSGVYTTREINLLLSHGGTIDLVEGYVFTDVGDLFKNFVDKYWKIRLDAKQAGRTGVALVAKLLLNSLYGKFGQMGISESFHPYSKATMDMLDKKGATYIPYFELGYIHAFEAVDVPHKFLAVAALVTSYARVNLYSFIQAAGEDYLYCDTDSVITRNFPPWTFGGGLGEMKLERAGPAILIERKLYWHADKAVHKGLGRINQFVDLSKVAKTHRLSSSEFITMHSREAYQIMLAGERIVVSSDHFPTPREVLAGTPPCKLSTRTRQIGFIVRKPAAS